MNRRSKKPAELSSLLQSTSGTLAQFSQKTKALKKIARIVRQICPDLPAESWHIANFSGQVVKIEVGSGIWGQRLQFEKNRIGQALAQETDGIFTTINLKVNPYFSSVGNNKNAQNILQAEKEEQPKKAMSESSAAQIEAVAECESAPESLKAKLRKLAKHVN